ncbi:NAD(P)H-binding protein [Mycobacterium paraintracellulare]|uniref:NAD(P)H-binding protein n=1 Tax=Mycobacterium paraintracellulare TaxID=1138383 RepID=UPI0019155D86|nr:NAD(P)H-binding protein [Mycobacterium paraintracellulare]
MLTSDDLYLVTAATGNTGAPTVRLLREAGHRVRAFVHTADRRADALADLGAEIVEGDLSDFTTVSPAMAGVTAAYFCYPIAPGGLLQATAIFAQAASEAGVRAIVNMSQISARREAKSHAAQHHWLAERLLDRTALITTHLRPTFFMEWIAWHWRRTGDGGAELRLPFADGRHAPIAAADQARVIAAILTNPAPHDRQIYPLYGAEEVNHHDIAAKLAAALGIPVYYEPIDIATFAKHLSAKGASDFLIQHLSEVARDYRNGIFAGTNNLVDVITGAPPTTVDAFVNAHRTWFDGSGRRA